MKEKKTYNHRYIIRLIIYFFMVSLVPVLIFTFITSNITEKRAISEMERQANKSVQNICTEIRLQMEEITALEKTLADDQSVALFVSEGKETDKNAALYSLYRQVSGRNRYSTTHIVSAVHTKGISTTSVPKGYLPRFNHNWGIFSLADQEEGTVFRLNDHSQNMIPGVCFSAATAIRDINGTVKGYVVQDVYHQLLEDSISKYSLEHDQKIFLVSRNNFIIYTNDRSYDEERLNLLPEDLRSTGKIYRKLDGEEYYINTSGPIGSGIRVVTAVPIAEIMENNRYIQAAAMWAGAFCMVLCIVFSIIANNDLSQPIKNLASAFRKIEEGNLSARITESGRKDEFGELENGFNTMAGKLEELIESTEEKQKRLRMAQSSALQAQINPHFLYNTLDLIKWNAKLGNNNEVSKIAVLLGKLLRSMADFEHDIVTVEDELKLIDRYLEIQSIHHGNRLAVKNQTDPSVLGCHIPKLIVQPLVENAVVHGIDPMKEVAEVGIRTMMENGYIVFTITDNGCGMDEETLSRMLSGELTGKTGIGLANVIKRAALYGDENCGVSVKSVPGEGTEVTLKIRPVEPREEGLNE